MKPAPFRRSVIPREEILKIQLISLIYFLVEGFVCLSLIVWHTSPWFYFPLHFLLTVPLIFLFPLKKIEGAIYYPFFILLFFFLGPFGALMALLFSLYYPYRIRVGKTFMEWYEGLFPTEYFEEKFPIYERMMADQEDYSSKEALVPFMDIMRSGSEEEKAEAINKILLYFRPSFTPALVMGLSDKNPSVRVRAATAVARLQQEAVDRRELLELRLKKNPQDEEALLALAKSEEEYAQTAFVNDVEKGEMFDKSISLYQQYLQLNPNAVKEQVRLAWLLFLRGKFEEANVEIEKSIAKRGIDSMNILKVYLKILFQKGDFKKIRQLSEVDYPFLQEQYEEEIRLRDILLLWRLSSFDEGSSDAS